MIYLSIINDYYECKEFLRKYDFIDDDDLYNDDYDLLQWFEGDPDWIDIRQIDGTYYRVYFNVFNADNSIDGEAVCLTTSDDDNATYYIQSYIEDKVSYEYYDSETWETYDSDKDHEIKVAIRGGIGYNYRLSYLV